MPHTKAIVRRVPGVVYLARGDLGVDATHAVVSGLLEGFANGDQVVVAIWRSPKVSVKRD